MPAPLPLTVQLVTFNVPLEWLIPVPLLPLIVLLTTLNVLISPALTFSLKIPSPPLPLIVLPVTFRTPRR